MSIRPRVARECRQSTGPELGGRATAASLSRAKRLCGLTAYCQALHSSTGAAPLERVRCARVGGLPAGAPPASSGTSTAGGKSHCGSASATGCPLQIWKAAGASGSPPRRSGVGRPPTDEGLPTDIRAVRLGRDATVAVGHRVARCLAGDPVPHDRYATDHASTVGCFARP